MTPVQTLWRNLEASVPTHEAGWLTQRVHPTAIVALYAAVAGASRLPGLLLEAPAMAVPVVTDYPSGRGFDLRAVSLVPGREGSVRLELRLTTTEYRDLFAVLVEDVIQAVTRATTAAAAVQGFIARLRVWQEFMRRRSPDGLSREEQTGLHSELHILDTLLMELLPAFDAVDAWHGPEQALHDFVRPGCHIEVKGTTRLPPASFEVSCLVQLDDTLASPLILAHLAWNTLGLTGTTLPNLVDRVRRRIGDHDVAALAIFNDKLMRVGYLDLHAGSYQHPFYNLATVQFFHVHGSFPRLTLAQVPTGIVECRYEIDLNACQAFILPADLARGLVLAAAP